MQKIICGIQQIGIGVSNVYEAWKWYRKHFGVDIRVFEDIGTADLMLPYTGGKPQERHAVLTVNLQSGGGFEVWQYTRRTPEAAKFDINLGDLGIYITKIKSKDVKATYESFKSKNLDLVSDILKDPLGEEHFFLKDPYGNLFQVVNGNYWFKEEKKLTGAVYGCIIGVSDIEKSRTLYSNILGYDEVVYDKEEQFPDFSVLPGGENKVRRVLLKHSKPMNGSFSKLFGPSQLELVKVYDREPKKIYGNRLWGDLGFIHLCFDIIGMKALKEECESNGFPFVADSSTSFDMGEVAGHFSYIEDPDGTLIEFVETHKVPIIKKLGLYINLRKKNPEKPLPAWMVKTLSFSRVKD